MRGPLLCFVISLMVFTCIAGCLAPSAPPGDLVNGTWRLVSYKTGNGLADAGASPPITLEFGKDLQISGNAGCNDYSGEYKPDGGLIAIRVTGSTEKYCSAPEGVMEMEQNYLLLLENTTRYSIDRDELTLSYYDVRKLLVFRRL